MKRLQFNHKVTFAIVGILMVLITFTFYFNYIYQTTPDGSVNGSEIYVTSPKTGQLISSGTIVSGYAPGSWFFEGSFPYTLITDSGLVLANSFVKAKSNWMTNDLVSFEAVLTFPMPDSGFGNLILKKDNPSGLPEHDASTTIRVLFKPFR